MEKLRFDDFDAFADSVSGIDSKMLMRNPGNRAWTIDKVGLNGVEVQIEVSKRGVLNGVAGSSYSAG